LLIHYNLFLKQQCWNLKKKNKIYPKFIIFYRDGVGEGQVRYVLDKEVKSIEKVFQKLGLDPAPGLCFFVVLKRIHTRLFLPQGNELINPTPGTIVDTGITYTEAIDFFLVSQSVNQGTATPTRYQVIFNTTKCGPNYLQSLTFQLCHMYFNWFGTIRVPAPCMYAHKIAFLVGQSISSEDTKLRLSDKLYYL